MQQAMHTCNEFTIIIEMLKKFLLITLGEGHALEAVGQRVISVQIKLERLRSGVRHDVYCMFL